MSDHAAVKELAKEIRSLVFKHINFVQQDQPWPVLDSKIAELIAKNSTRINDKADPGRSA